MKTSARLQWQGVILDMDGLLIDTEPSFLAAWGSAMLAMGHELPVSAAPELRGTDASRVIAKLRSWFGPEFELDAFLRISEQFWLEHIASNGLPLMPGATALLDSLNEQGLPYCLATNSPRSYAEKCLEVAGIEERVPLRITRDSVCAPKPAPDLLLTAAKQLGLTAADCLAVDDSITGLRAATSAGMAAVWVPYGWPPVETFPARAVLTDLHALVEWLQVQ